VGVKKGLGGGPPGRGEGVGVEGSQTLWVASHSDGVWQTESLLSLYCERHKLELVGMALKSCGDNIATVGGMA